MGRIALIVDTLRRTVNGSRVTDIKGEPGGGATAQAQQFSAAGDDVNPLPDDYALFVELPSGAFASAGTLDTQNAQTANPGERRVYGRGPDGVEVGEVYLKNDGAISISNDTASVAISATGGIVLANGAGSLAILEDGTVNINGVVIAPGGAAVVPVTLTVNGIDFGTHPHPYTWTDVAGSSITGGPTP